MEIGLFTEFQCPPGMSESRAFDESMAQMRAAEELGFDAVWLAELHFQKGRSVLASPLMVASALAASTRRLKLGIAVQVLPLSHPLRLAEDVATLDHLCQGRLEFGVGRSGLPGHYQGFNIPYAESRVRFLETLEILRLAWTQERFSFEGQYFHFRDVGVTPKPFQQPHPPLRVAATSRETYAMVGDMGHPLFIAVRTSSIEELRQFIGSYRDAWKGAGHPGRGDVALSVPVYVAETSSWAREEPEATTMHFFRAISQALQQPDATGASMTDAQEGRARRLAALTYEDILREQVVYGTPAEVAERLQALQEELDFTTLSAWMNVGGQLSHPQVLRSMQLFADQVIPRLA
jgi:alkanesulfonate monooxygenase SsuD/methylene tetrahydromethanopterin reductase-like flavin-dependent oxidoreductase (luciferase family)